MRLKHLFLNFPEWANMAIVSLKLFSSYRNKMTISMIGVSSGWKIPSSYMVFSSSWELNQYRTKIMRGFITCLNQNYCNNGKRSYGSQSMIYCNLQSFWQPKHKIIRIGIFWCSGQVKRHWVVLFLQFAFRKRKTTQKLLCRKQTDFFKI